MRRRPQNMLGVDCLAQPVISGGAPFERAAEVGCGGGCVLRIPWCGRFIWPLLDAGLRFK